MLYIPKINYEDAKKLHGRSFRKEKIINDTLRMNTIHPHNPLNQKMSCNKLTDHFKGR